MLLDIIYKKLIYIRLKLNSYLYCMSYRIVCSFLYNLHKAQVSCVCVWVDSWLLQDTLVEELHQRWRSLSPLFHNVNFFLQYMKNSPDAVVRRLQEYDYNMTHRVAVSILNLPVKWQAFYIRFLHHSSEWHKQISALQHDVRLFTCSADWNLCL